MLRYAIMFAESIQARRNGFYGDGKLLKLAGNHTWNTVQPIAGKTIPIDRITGNFTRLWTLETRGVDFNQNPSWGSNTPGVARISNVPWKEDGSLNKRYYKSLEKVVSKAEEKDIVTGVVLFEHTLQAYFGQGWENHPLNGLGPNAADQIHTKGSWNQFQRAHVKKVVKTLEPYNNVIYEVGNELHRNSLQDFQKMVVKWVQKFTDKPIGVSYASAVYRDQSWMTKVDADFIVPGNGARAGGVRKITGFKGPQILDTDHGWALNSNVSGLRTAWSQGRPLWLMDGFDGTMLRNNVSLASDKAYISSLV